MPWTPASETTEAIIEAGRALGHDLYTLSHWPRDAAWPHPLREGFDAASLGSGRRRTADRHTRKWLQLRIGAWLRGRVVAPDVTPQLLAEIDLAECPVTRLPLTHGERADTDASVDRLNNQGAYCAANLAVMSVRANRAKGARCFAEVWALAQRATPTDGLQAQEWLRLAALMLGSCFVEAPFEAPLLPLCAPLPLHSARLAEQQWQRLLTLGASRPAGKNALLRALRPVSQRQAVQWRMGALAEVVHQQLKTCPEQGEGLPSSRSTRCWDVWLRPGVMEAFTAWRSSLDGAEWARAARLAGQLAQGRALTPSALQAWHLPQQGYWPGMALAGARLGVPAQVARAR